jgi:hypothetical protein
MPKETERVKRQIEIYTNKLKIFMGLKYPLAKDFKEVYAVINKETGYEKLEDLI